jgi:hypothetical protein
MMADLRQVLYEKNNLYFTPNKILRGAEEQEKYENKVTN